MLQNRLGTRTKKKKKKKKKKKTSQTRLFCVFAVYLPLVTRLWTFRKWSTEFCSDSVSIDRLSDRFGINFRNSHPDLNIPSKKFRRTECKTSLILKRTLLFFRTVPFWETFFLLLLLLLFFFHIQIYQKTFFRCVCRRWLTQLHLPWHFRRSWGEICVIFPQSDSMHNGVRKSTG